MKKKYINPNIELYLLDTSKGILAGSYQATPASRQLAPEMMNLPEENEQTEYEE